VSGPLVWLIEPFTHRFMQHALIAIVLVGVICGVTGAFVTLRGLAFMGDALTHAIFPGVVIAFLLGANFLIGALIAAVIVSLGIGVVSQSGRLSNDTTIGVLFAGGFALGVALISAQRSYARDVTSFLFGSILGVSQSDLLLTTAVGAIVLGAMLLFRRELVAVAFDRTFAAASGLHLWRWDQLFLLLLSLAIVVSLQTVGNILVLAMLVTPAATARLLTDRLGVMVTLAAAIGAASGVVGLLASYYLGVASGASVGGTGEGRLSLYDVGPHRVVQARQDDPAATRSGDARGRRRRHVLFRRQHLSPAAGRPGRRAAGQDRARARHVADALRPMRDRARSGRAGRRPLPAGRRRRRGAGRLLPRSLRGAGRQSARSGDQPLADVTDTAHSTPDRRRSSRCRSGTSIASWPTDANRSRRCRRMEHAMDDKSQKTIADYVGDMVALESHIEEALDRQKKMASEFGPAGSAVRQFHDMVKRHRDELRAYQDQIGSTAGNPIKEAGSAVLGKAAGMIDKIRTEGVSKDLRDDYTAFNHAAISYAMLNVTALALGDKRTADIASRNLTDYAGAVQEINQIIGQVVVWELGKDHHKIVDQQAASESRNLVDRAWRSTSPHAMPGAMGSASSQESGSISGV
jgi:manganese/iron transport system permease protein